MDISKKFGIRVCGNTLYRIFFNDGNIVDVNGTFLDEQESSFPEFFDSIDRIDVPSDYQIFIIPAETQEDGEKLISGVSYSAADSLRDGGPGQHGGFLLNLANGYLATTSGGVIYGYSQVSVESSCISVAILGMEEEGTLSKTLEKEGWAKTDLYDWVVNCLQPNIKCGLGAPYPDRHRGLLTESQKKEKKTWE